MSAFIYIGRYGRAHCVAVFQMLAPWNLVRGGMFRGESTTALCLMGMGVSVFGCAECKTNGLYDILRCIRKYAEDACKCLCM